MTEMQEAFAAIGEQIEQVKVAPAKIPAGKTIVAVKLDRDETVSGRFMTAIKKGWQPQGMALAINAGHVLAANYIFGRWTNGVPKVSACHLVTCQKCGKQMIMPLAVWEAKDNARASGVKTELDKGISGFELLRRYGHCSCGGKWTDDSAAEKRSLTAFADEVLKAVEAGGQVPAFLPPKAFTVHEAAEAVELGTEWSWLKDAMSAQGKSAVPFEQNATGDTLVFNPGFWLGYVDNHDDTELFFLEKGKDRMGRGRGFNPAEANGL